MCISLNRELGLGAAAASVCRVGVTAEFELLSRGQLQNFLEALADALEALAALQRISRFVFAAFGWLTSRSSPESDTPESLADVDDHAHDLVIALVLEHLANGSEHDVQPSLIIRLAAFEGVCPSSTVLVLLVLPLWSYAVLEEMIVGLLGELRGRRDVVLKAMTLAAAGEWKAN